MTKEFEKSYDEIIWDIFQKDSEVQGFKVTNQGISLTLEQLQRARARGGYTIGQLVHQAKASSIPEALTFDDITGAPYRALASREDANVKTFLARELELNIPLISSNMECVTGYDLALILAQMGGVGILHQFCRSTEEADLVQRIKETPVKEFSLDEKIYESSLDQYGRYLVGAAIGVKGNLYRANKLVEAGADFLVIDLAHGHSDQTIDKIKKLKNKYPNLPLIAGNVVTPKGAYELCDAGVDGLKVGVGPGAACTTRIITGYGIPQITAIYETAIIAKKFGVTIMADGGIRNSGDIVKGLAAGADSVLLGRLFAATEQSNFYQERFNPSGGVLYYGSASERSKQKQGRKKTDTPEGRDVYLEPQGNTAMFIAKLITGIKSGISYSGNSRDPEHNENANIRRLRIKSRWVRQTSAGLYEANKGNPKV